MKKESKIGLGIVLILLSFFTIKSISFESAEAIGFSIVTLGLIVSGVYLVYKGFKNNKKNNNNDLKK